MTYHLKSLAPNFTLPSHLGKNVTLSDLRGKNVVLAFFPLTWTPVCSSQIPAYEAELAKFASLDTQILAISVDSTPSQIAWAESLGGIHYPILSDFWPHGHVASAFGVLRQDGRSERAVFLIDKESYIRYADIHDINEAPSNIELRKVIREIDPSVLDRPEEIADSNAPLPHGGVVMYCTPWCPDCKEARIWLKGHNIEYTEVDISTNAKGAKQVEMWAEGSRTTPTFDIDGTIIVDYDLEQLEKTLGR
jgi:peroxiredoxin (alkyl hydroperoxide reductase subunit C)